MKRSICLLLASIILTVFAASAPFAQDIDEFYTRPKEPSVGIFLKWVFDFSQIKKSYALVIGISDYSAGFSKLEAPYHDAVRVKDFLLNDAGFDQVYLLTNAAATRDRIIRLMEETFPKLLGKNDRFLFYFSGHGVQRVIEKNQLGYLVLSDAGKTEYGKMISMKLIDDWDSLLKPKRHVLFVLDACFSGLAGHQLKSPPKNERLERLSQYAHHLITAGSADEESVASLNKWGGSLFTDAFIKGASGKADTENADFGRDGIVSLKELVDYIEKRIDIESSNIKSIKMSPQMSHLQDNEGEFFFIDKKKKDSDLGKDLTIYSSSGGQVQKKGLEEKNTIVTFTKLRDDEFRSQGFTLKKPMNLQIYAIGEGRDGEMFDYGWIVEAKTRKKVWEMRYRDTEHAGGSQKNRMFDDVVQLDKGSYLAYFVTDDSHSPYTWNSPPPYDPARWGMTIRVAEADKKYVKKFEYKGFEESSDIDTKSQVAPELPRLRTLSSGQEILKGSYTFDLDTGQQGGSSPDADIFWEHQNEILRYLNAWNGARFSYLGKVDFEQVSEKDLLTADYNVTRLNGSANQANQLVDETVILIQTNIQNLCKLRIEKYGIAAPGDLPHWPKSALLIRWVTYTTK